MRRVYVYTIDDGAEPWTSEPMTYEELNDQQKTLADCLRIPGEEIKLSSWDVDIRMEMIEEVGR